MTKRALFIGRFQPFHHGHYYVLQKLLKKFDEVVVVIGSAEDAYSIENPFTCGERIEMIRVSLNKNELFRTIVVPVSDVNNNTVWVDHVLMHIPAINEVYSNNQLVKMLFSQHGILVKSIEFYDRGNKEGSYIRKLIVEGDGSWKRHVPKRTAGYLESIDAEKRIKKIVRMG